MKRSDKMAKLLKINKLHERLAASEFASASDQHDRVEEQLTRLEQYWDEYSVQLESLKQVTSSVDALRTHQDFLTRLNEAITQQRGELSKSGEALENSQNRLLECSIEVEKIRKARDSLREKEQVEERRQRQKEHDELVSNRRR